MSGTQQQMPELMRHHIAKNDKEVVKLTRRTHVAHKHPGLRPCGESQLVRRSMKVPRHLLWNEFQDEPGEPRDITARNQRNAIGGVATPFHPTKIYSCMVKNATYFGLGF